MKVFLSHATEDKILVNRARSWLEQQGIDVWQDDRHLQPGGEFVTAINNALADTDAVLLFWSEKAALSRWVDLEWSSTLARCLNGGRRPPSLTVIKLDEAAPPALLSSRLTLSFAAAEPEQQLAKWLETQQGESAARYRSIDASIPREVELKEVVANVSRGKPCVVLAPLKGGSSNFAGQLKATLAVDHPNWCVLSFQATPMPDEEVADYLQRFRIALDCGGDWERIIMLVDGWRNRLEEHETMLGKELHARAQLGIVGSAKLSVVAIGGAPLFRMRYGRDDSSWLTSFDEVFLDDFCADQIQQVLHRIEENRWDENDAKELARFSGGHPYLLKLLLKAGVNGAADNWRAAAEELYYDKNFLAPIVARAVQCYPEQLKQLLNGSLRFRIANPHSAVMSLYWDGLLQRRGARGRELHFRCDVIRTLVEDELLD